MSGILTLFCCCYCLTHPKQSTHKSDNQHLFLLFGGFYLTSSQEWSQQWGINRNMYIQNWEMKQHKLENSVSVRQNQWFQSGGNDSKSGQTVRETRPGEVLSSVTSLVCLGTPVKTWVEDRAIARAADETSSGANHSVPHGIYNGSVQLCYLHSLECEKNGKTDTRI